MANQQSKNMKGGPASRQRAEIIHQWWSVALQAKEPAAPLLFNCQKMSVNEEEEVGGSNSDVRQSEMPLLNHPPALQKNRGSDRLKE